MSRFGPGVRSIFAIALGAIVGVPMALSGAGQQGAASSQPPPQTPATSQQRPVFRAGANFVLVDAYPTRDGMVVEGLTADDFQILEDGVPQAIENVQFVRVEPAQAERERRDPNNTREMIAAAADPTKRVFVVYLDALHVSIDGSQRIRTPLGRALNQIIGADDLVAVTTQDLPPRQIIFGRRLLTIDEQLVRNWPWGIRGEEIRTNRLDPNEAVLKACFQYYRSPRGQVIEWYVPDGAIERLMYLVMLERYREDRTIASLESLVSYLGTLRDARTVVLIVSSGWRLFGPDRALEAETSKHNATGPESIYSSGSTPLLKPEGGLMPEPAACNRELIRLAQLDTQQRMRELIERANRANVSFYAIAPGGLDTFDTPISEPVKLNPNARIDQSVLGQEVSRTRDRAASLQTAAENTNGLAIVSTNDLEGGIKRIVNDVSAYYLIGYYSTNRRFDGKYRRIEVTMKSGDVRVRARRGYVAPDEKTAANPDAPAAPERPGVPAEADAALGVLGRLRPEAELFLRGVATPRGGRVAAELGRSDRARKWIAVGGEVQAAAVTEDGKAVGLGTGRIEAGTRGAMVTVPLMADAALPLRVTVTIGEGVDRIQDQVTIAEGATAADALGGELLFRATPSPRSPLLAVADYQFRRTERVHVELPILKPLDDRGIRLLARDGRPLAVPVTVTERERDGQMMLAADINLAPLTEGEYLLEVTARAGGASVSKYAAIRVIR
ncbi:MAG TPA: VWA domain-containing protein [Vicinamibacterales bacterium]|nr:VWA domain-containing protein [Vicinamibacterales bacterium]